MVEGNDIAQAVALRRGILDMPHVQVEPPAVEQETAVARRFFVVPIVQINRAESRDIEMWFLTRIGNASGRPAGPRCDQAAVFGLQPDNAVHKSFSALRISFSSSRRNFFVAVGCAPIRRPPRGGFSGIP